MQQINNPQLELAYNFVQYTHRNVFLTGKAGTGKTTFLQQLKSQTLKRSVVVAPTGVAAINAGGVTIHSFFQLPFGPKVPKQIGEHVSFGETSRVDIVSDLKLSGEKINIIRSLDLLVIDEISMVRADLLDAIDEVLKRYRRNPKPFGGVQLLMIGDIQQLPPVVKKEDWDLLRHHYSSLFFFDSIALKQTNYISIELKHIYRQSNTSFISILNKIRDNRLDQSALDELNKRYIPNFQPKSDDGYITLTTHNRQAQELNESKLIEIASPEFRYEANIEGDFPELSYPTDKELVLKIGAQVMFLKNDPSREKLYYNGKIGIVTGFAEEGILVTCPEMSDPIVLGREKWENMKYSLNEITKEIVETPIGSFTQFPLKLAWAITIHKSQGLTFEKAIIYAGGAFAHGQVYVALSRCKTLEGLVLGMPIRPGGIINDSEVDGFSRKVSENEPNIDELADSKNAYQIELLTELFDYQSIVRNLYTLQKLIKDNISILPNDVIQKIASTIASVKKNFVDVADKFSVQIRQLASISVEIDENQLLQERITKAVAYYQTQNDLLVDELNDNYLFDLDNKAVKKSLNEPIMRILSDLKIKTICLEACRNGFVFEEYLAIRAKAQIEEPSRKPRATASHKSSEHRLTTLLKSWRNDKADDLNVSAFNILSQKSIQALTQSMPVTMKELKAIRGIGAQKQRQFGAEILEIIAKYKMDNQIETNLTVNFSEEDSETPKLAKSESKNITLDLFRSGKNVVEIALERGLAVSTVEGHLSQHISSGMLLPEDLIDKKRVDLIRSYFLESNKSSLVAAKEFLGEDVSYTEIRYVLNRLMYEGKIEQP